MKDSDDLAQNNNMMNISCVPHKSTKVYKILTLFLSDLASIGSSAANMADENIIQNNIMLLK